MRTLAGPASWSRPRQFTLAVPFSTMVHEKPNQNGEGKGKAEKEGTGVGVVNLHWNNIPSNYYWDLHGLAT